MSVRQPRYSMEEFQKRGTEIYQKNIRPLVENTAHGKVVAIDIDSGLYEIGNQTLDAAEKLLARCPDAQIWCVRVGFRAVESFNRRPLPEKL